MRMSMFRKKMYRRNRPNYIYKEKGGRKQETVVEKKRQKMKIEIRCRIKSGMDCGNIHAPALCGTLCFFSCGTLCNFFPLRTLRFFFVGFAVNFFNKYKKPKPKIQEKY